MIAPVAVTGWSALSCPRAGDAIPDFDIRHALGRKGTGFFDRATGLGVIACGQAIEDSGIDLGAAGRDRAGIVFGTTAGSLKSTMDFSAETLTQDRPYLVNPGLFPNTVMNCVAGQAAIWHGLKGVNATLAGGHLALIQVLRYATRVLARGYADVLLAGVVEEFTPQSSWAARLTGRGPAGEGAAVFLLEGLDQARAAGRHVDAELLAVRTGPAADLAGCVRDLLATAGLDQALAGELAREAAERQERLRIAAGDCQAAAGGLELAAVLAGHRNDIEHDGAVSLLTAGTRDGGCGAIALRGYSRVGADYR